MAVYAFTSFSGSPGVTTTLVAWATSSTTPTLLVEADVTGGSPILAGRLRSQVRHAKSLLSLLSRDQEDQEGWLAEALRSQRVPLPGASADSHLIPTIAEHGQARLLDSAWSRIFAALEWLSKDTGIEVLIDLGRVGAHGTPVSQALTQTDALVVMSRTTLPALVSTLNNLPALADKARGPLVSAVMIESPIEGFPPQQIRSQLGAVPMVGAIGHHPSAAAVYHLGWQSARSSALRRYHAQVDGVRDELRRQVATHQDVVLGVRTGEV